MTRRVKIGEAKTHLSALLADVEAGEDLVICRGPTPVAHPGLCAGESGSASERGCGRRRRAAVRLICHLASSPIRHADWRAACRPSQLPDVGYCGLDQCLAARSRGDSPIYRESRLGEMLDVCDPS